MKIEKYYCWPRSHLSWQTAFIMGPVAGGFIYAYAPAIVPGVTGISATLIMTFFFIMLSLVLVFRLRKYPAVGGKKENTGKSLLEGIRFVFHHKLMLYTMSMQLLTPDRMRGRVSAVNSMFIGSSAEIGDFESGMAAKLLGTIPAVLLAAV